MRQTIIAALFVLCSASAVSAGAKSFGMFVSDGRTWTPIQLFDSLGDCDVKARRAYETGKYKGVGCREMSGQDTVLSPRRAPVQEWNGEAVRQMDKQDRDAKAAWAAKQAAQAAEQARARQEYQNQVNAARQAIQEENVLRRRTY